MVEIKATHKYPIPLGRTGENEAARIAFTLAPFEEVFPGGTPALLVKRKGDSAAYPVTLTVEGLTAYWTVTSADTDKAGFGQCELQWHIGDTLAKSNKFDFIVVPALEAGAEPPDEPSKRWFDAIQAQIGDLSKLTTKAKDNLVAAINEAARSGGGSGGAGTIDMRVADGYIQYSNDGTTWENLIAIDDLKGATGKDGTDGHTPVITASKSGKVTTIKADGEAIATVNDGADGTNGADGAPGKDGVTPDIQIGTVTTLPAGSEATASMGGTAAQPTLNLGIPKGANGDNANVTKDAVVGALGFTPIGADDVPVKSVNGQTGAAKSTFYVTVTQGNGDHATADKTAAEVYAAYEAGYAVYAIAKFTGAKVPYTLPLLAAVSVSGTVMLGFATIGSSNSDVNPQGLVVLYNGAAWSAWSDTLAKIQDIPTIPSSLKNPYSLDIKIGNTTTSYDGSAAKTVEIPDGGGTDESLGITGAAAEQFPKIKAVDAAGKPTAWEPVTGEEVTLGSGDEWVKVAEKTLTEIANEIRLNFNPCKAVYIEFQYGAVENDLGVIGIYPNPKTPVYTAENRAAAITQTTSATNKRGYIFCTIDCRKGTQWVATSQTFFRGDGTFGSIEPGATMNCDIFVFNNNTWASLLWKQQMANADHINSVSAFGAGMNIGTTLTVWGIKA